MPHKIRPNDEISATFECLSPPILVIYYAFAFLFEEKFPKICSATTRKWCLIASYCKAFCTKTQCNMHQNAMQYAPKRNAICTKTQCNMHQNAVQYAPKRRVICTKTRGKMLQNASKSHKKHRFKGYL